MPRRGRCVQTFRVGKWQYSHDGEVLSEGLYTADKSREPASFDQVTTAGRDAGHTLRFIYRVDGDTLQTALRLDERWLPKSFEEDGAYICTWKRVKK
jgi:uncharacterized protein (TIGR03067 family)